MTHVLLLAVALLNPAPPRDTFDVRAELQGLYDEMSQATLQFATASDVDAFHDVLYTADWVLNDAGGHPQTWADVRPGVIRALNAPRLDSMIQPIRKLSFDAEGVTVMVSVIAVHSLVDQEGRYGRPNASHTLTETTVYRDRWVRVGDGWKLKSRDQIGRASESVDKPE